MNPFDQSFTGYSQFNDGRNAYYKRKRQRSESTGESEEIKDYFNKRFDFKRDKTWVLPKPECMYNEKKWSIDKFHEMKDELNRVKSLLGQFNLSEWSLHTKRRDPAGYVFRELKRHIKPELLTQAWCKFYECLNQFPIINEDVVSQKKLNSLHLCEAPGAFISALNHFLQSNYDGMKWNWIANTLNPEYEGNNLKQMIPDKRLITHTRGHWNFGLDNTGDVLKYYNYKAIIEEAERYDKISLVTADGSMDCMSNPGEQESLVEHLHFCELIIALSVLSLGGTFVIKMFTMFECSSICLLYFLNCCFSSLHVFKPCTSKSGNSEVYAICLNYKGKPMFIPYLEKLVTNYKNPNPDVSMFTLDSIPYTFVSQVEECSNFFMQKQIKTIYDNIYCFKKILPIEYRKCDYIKNAIGSYYLSKYNLKPIDQFLIRNCVKPNKMDYNVVIDNEISTNLILYGVEMPADNQVSVEFLTGKQVATVLYSEFCDTSLIRQLNESYDTNTFHSTFLTEDICTENYDAILNVKYDINNKLYASLLFNEVYSVIMTKITCKNKLLLVGPLFLTRFEAGLLYLIIACFSKMQCISPGLISLQNATCKIFQVRNLLEKIKCQISETSNHDCIHFERFTLNILPNNLLRNHSYEDFLVRYNNATMEYYLQNINL